MVGSQVLSTLTKSEDQTIDADRRYIGRLKATCKLTQENFL